MHFGVISLFPEMFAAVSEYGVTGKAFAAGRVSLNVVNPKHFTTDKHQTVDDKSYGGGPGMVMKIEPLVAALMALRDAMPGGAGAKVAYLSPQGRLVDQSAVQELSQREAIIFVAGRYEGIDERFIERYVDEEWSLGDYVVSGGELPAMTLIDAVTRNLPGVLGDEQSAAQDSFVHGWLDHPHYTRPEEFQGMQVPEVLLSGNHDAIAEWRMQQALGRTLLRRPDLLNKLELSEVQQKQLQRFKSASAEASTKARKKQGAGK